MMNKINAIGNQPQITFQAKKGNRKQIHEFIDKANDMAMDLLNKDRPLEEKREILIRDTLLKLKIKCPFIGKKVKPEEAAIEHINPSSAKYYETEFLKYQQYIDKAVADGMIDAEHAGVLLRNKGRAMAEQKVANMSNWEIIKDIVKAIFKK